MNVVFLVADYQPSVNGPETMDHRVWPFGAMHRLGRSALAVQE
jgi:hypothetical protein